MNWVLILITWGNAVAYVPFDTQATCEAAKAKMPTAAKYAECFKK